MATYEKYINQVGAMGNIEGAIISGQYPADVMNGLTLALKIVRNTTLEDVAPVVHAKWIEEEEPCEIVFITPDGKATTELYIEVKCSNCKRYTGYVYSHYLACQNEYCQHCGAKMDGGHNDG